MIRGLYSSAAGMIAESLRNDTIANNLANASTTGYKKDIAVTKDFASMLIYRINDGAQAEQIGSLGAGSLLDEVATIHTTGSIRPTGNQLDAAIEGQGYFTVETPNGVRYTRDGSFSRSGQGQLVTKDGNRVLGVGGPIQLPDGQVTISPDGRIQVDGQQIGQLQLTEFANERQELQKEGSNLYVAKNGVQGTPAANSQVLQSSLEMSNVNVVSEMVNMIAGQRTYEMNAKAIQAHDQLMDKAVNEVGKA